VTGRPTAEQLVLPFPAELVEQIAERAAELVLERIEASPPSRWMTIAEAADYARCSRQHIYDLRSDGRLGRHGERGHALVDRRELDAYLDNGKGL
jgi:excisionase family DNA binding protein